MRAQKVKHLRKKAGLTQAEMADILGCSAATVCGYETGKVNIPYDIAKMYTSYFRCPSDYLYNDNAPLMDDPGMHQETLTGFKMPVLRNMALPPTGKNLFGSISHPFIERPYMRKCWLASREDGELHIMVVAESENFREGDRVVVVLNGETTVCGYYYIDEERRVCIKSKPKGNKGIRNIKVGLGPDDKIIGFVELDIVKK